MYDFSMNTTQEIAELCQLVLKLNELEEKEWELDWDEEVVSLTILLDKFYGIWYSYWWKEKMLMIEEFSFTAERSEYVEEKRYPTIKCSIDNLEMQVAKYAEVAQQGRAAS